MASAQMDRKIQTDRNCLSSAASAYLRQHADNPVHWQEWSKDTLAEAKSQNKPILLSIGYAACHWCHVMAHESFEDEAVAMVMNDHFINVKVDREERPDIDQIYMAALTAMGQQGGWPLTMFLRPDGKPFWGGTYFPRHRRHNMPGIIDVLTAVHNLWLTDQDRINQNSEAIYQHVEAKLAVSHQQQPIEPALFDAMVARLDGMIDKVKGGISGAPKFPNAPYMDALWLSWLYERNETHRDSFILSLKTMLQGGMYDHLGGGLCRYSTDENWLVPHFEKMLYDNAQLLRHANHAYAATRDELFRIRIEETVAWLLRELRLPDGSFASSLDADSDGVEGKYYVWSEEEIDRIAGDTSAFFKAYYGVTQAGNWEGHNILNRLHAVNEPAQKPSEIIAASERMVIARAQRTRPGRDDKTLTDWNGLAIRALAETGRHFRRNDWINCAREAYRAIIANRSDGMLPHAHMNGMAFCPALSTDYAAMINAALALYEATGEPSYVTDAQSFKQMLDRDHADSNGDYRLTGLLADDVIIHSYGDHDEAIPSATSQIIEALTRLHLATGDLNLYEDALAVAERAYGRALRQHYGQIGILCATRFLSDPLSLTITDYDSDSELVSLANRSPDPRRLDRIIPFNHNAIINLPGAEVQVARPTAWLCKGHVCLPPASTSQELQLLLGTT